MAKKLSGGSSKNKKDSAGKRLGVKVFGLERVNAGTIIVRQRGLKFKPDINVGVGKDHTIYSLIDGTVYFFKKNNIKYIKVL